MHVHQRLLSVLVVCIRLAVDVFLATTRPPEEIQAVIKPIGESVKAAGKPAPAAELKGLADALKRWICAEKRSTAHLQNDVVTKTIANVHTRREHKFSVRFKHGFCLK